MADLRVRQSFLLRWPRIWGRRNPGDSGETGKAAPRSPPAPGPYELHLSVWKAGWCLTCAVHRRRQGAAARSGAWAVPPRLIKDYQLLVDSHAKAVEEGRAGSRIQAIDMGRRGVAQRRRRAALPAAGWQVIAIDFETVQGRLFTLVCVLHTRVLG